MGKLRAKARPFPENITWDNGWDKGMFISVPPLSLLALFWLGHIGAVAIFSHALRGTAVQWDREKHPFVPEVPLSWGSFQ